MLAADAELDIGPCRAAAIDRDLDQFADAVDIEVGVCGEHGGDPESVGFFHRAGLDYVSCSPFRVPIARLAAAQAAIAG